MTNLRRKIAVSGTVLGLGGLAGFAMASNPVRDSQGGAQTPIAATQLAAADSPATTGAAPASSSSPTVITRTSGAAAPVPASYSSQPVSNPSRPVTTRTSSGGAGAHRGERSGEAETAYEQD